MNKIVEIKNKIKQDIVNGIAPYRGLRGNGDIVSITHKEEKKILDLINVGKTNEEIISLYHQNLL